MTTIIDSASATKQIYVPPLTSYDITLTQYPTTTVVSGGSTVTSTNEDSSITTTTSATVDTAAMVGAVDAVPGLFVASSAVFSSADPSVATVDQHGNVTRVTDGTAGIIASTEFVKRRVDVTVSRSMTSSVAWNNFVSGSAAKNAYDAIQSRITVSGLTPASYANCALFSTRDDADATYAWNANFWGHDIDLTCLSPWNSYHQNQQAGTLVSPRHLIFANHYVPATGTTIRFIESDGTVVARTVTALQRAGSVADIAVAILDSDVPSGISFANVLPADAWTAKLPGISYLSRLPILCTNQDKWGFVGSLGVLSPRPGADTQLNSNVPSDTTQFAFAIQGDGLPSPRMGDSGSPSFLVINGAPVVVMLWTATGSGTTSGAPQGLGSDVLTYTSDINTAMHSLSIAAGASTDYQLTAVDLSGFTSY